MLLTVQSNRLQYGGANEGANNLRLDCVALESINHRTMQLNQTLNALFFFSSLSLFAAAQDGSLDTKPVHEDESGEVAKSPEDVVSVEGLRERSGYVALDKGAVEALAKVAKARWPEELSAFAYQRVENFSAGGVSHWMSVWLHRKSGLEFVLVPGGKFQMGSRGNEAQRKEDELQHWVTLDPFMIARTECTQGAWAGLAVAAGVDGEVFEGDAQLPKVGMSPGDVEAWCKRAGLMLPTEAQWEFMCRAGTSSAWAMGADKRELKRYANIGSGECPEDWKQVPGITEAWLDGYGAEAAPVGKFAANAFGLFDVHGNVYEWARDDYISYAQPVEWGTGRRSGKSGERIARGGNFGSNAAVSRSAARAKFGSGISPGANKGFGFRPSLDLRFPPSIEDWASATIELPPSFAPGLPKGLESLRVAPGWRDPEAEDFWSYAFVMWIDEPATDAAQIGAILNDYYDGLMTTFAKGAGRDIGKVPSQVEVVRAGPNRYEVQMRVVDGFATFKPIGVRILVEAIAESDASTTLRIQLSSQPKGHPIWRSLDAAIASIEKP